MAFVLRGQVLVCHIASLAALIVQYRMRVRCISDWLDETQPIKIARPPDLRHIIRGTLRRNAFRFSFCLHNSALYLRQFTARARDETSSQAKTPLAGSRAAPLWLARPFSSAELTAAYSLVLTRPADAQ